MGTKHLSSRQGVMDSMESAIKFALEKLQKDVELKKEQRKTVELLVKDRKDVLAILPTGFGKSLIFHILPFVFDFIEEGGQPDSTVIVISPLNGLIRDQIDK